MRLPQRVIREFGFALYAAQVGVAHQNAKPVGLHQGATQGIAANGRGDEMKRKGRVAGVKFQLSSGNVYADLGVRDADAMLVKAELVMAISQIIRERGLTQAAAADLLGLTQPKLSNLLRGQFHGVSERRLIDCLTRLGRDVEIVVKQKPRSRASGKLSVTVIQHPR